MQMDIGFGDAITPQAAEAMYSVMLDQPAPVLLTYPRETAIAEKFEATVKLGIANSRMKDFHDLRSLAELFAFDGKTLFEAIRRTFERRGTPVPTNTALPTVFTSEFFDDEAKQKQWKAFVSKNKQYVPAMSLREVVAAIERFLIPLIAPPSDEDPSGWTWPAGGPWSNPNPQSRTTALQCSLDAVRLVISKRHTAALRWECAQYRVMAGSSSPCDREGRPDRINSENWRHKMTHTPDPQLFERPINILVVGCGGNGQRHRRRTAIPAPGASGIWPSRRPECHAHRSRDGKRDQLRPPAILPNRDWALQGAIVLAHRVNMFWGLSWHGMQVGIEQLKGGGQSRHPHWLCRHPQGTTGHQSLGNAVASSVLAGSGQ